MPSLRLLLLTLLLPSTTGSFAQCGTIPLQNVLVPRHTDLIVERGGLAPFIIPTVVHIHYSGPILPLGVLHVGPILDQCNADLRGMGTDIGDVIPAFANIVGDMGVELQLATIDDEGNCMSGIQYHEYDLDIGPQPGLYTLDTRRYLNIHVYPSTNSFATYPTPITEPYNNADFICLSTYDASFRPRTLAHEMGHWGGLLHTFGNTSNSGVTCDDDLIADTPPTAGSVVGSCDIGLSDCTPGVVENVQNHMDYSTCGIMFTEGQADHVVAVMMDPSLVRAAVHSATNLAACGVGMEPGCTIMPDMHWRIQEQCSGTLVDLRAIAEHQVPDSVRWTFADGIPTTSTSDSPQVTYLTTGIHSVELKVCKDGTCTTIQRDIDLNVPDAGSNGLALISSFPFSEDFENGFSLPRPNMMVHSTSHPTWQPCSLAGHESANSLYVPSVSTITAQDTSVLVIGNFDFTGLQQPTIQFNVSTSSYTFANWCWLDVLFKDLCSSIFVGDVWATRGLNEMAGDNGPGFIPTEAGQWTTVTVTFPSWNMAGSAELGIRLRRPANAQNGHTVEHFFLDDLYVGELPRTTGMAESGARSTIQVMPNPNEGDFTVHFPGDVIPGTLLNVIDATGRIVHQERVGPGPSQVTGITAPGPYTIVIEGVGSTGTIVR